MTTPKSLPSRPSRESLHKQAKKLMRELARGDADAIARMRAQLPEAAPPFSQRDAQLVLAREYGFSGWQALLAEIHKRLGRGLEWAAAAARRIIHDNDIEGLQQLLAEHPALLSWRGEASDASLLGMATGSFGDSGHPASEQHFTRAACAELLLDAGAVIAPAICDDLVHARARGLLQLFQRKGVLPHTLKFCAALGDVEAVRAQLRTEGSDRLAIIDAFRSACRLEYVEVAAVLLDALLALDTDLRNRIDAGPGRAGLIAYLSAERVLDFTHAAPADPWQEFVMQQVVRALQEGDRAAFVAGLQREPWLLGEACVDFQAGLIQRAILRDRGELIAALLELSPALLRRRPPPGAQALEFAFTYVKPHLLPLLTRIWPLPDDLPHAAGLGDLARVQRWFDADGRPVLGDLSKHFPANDAHTRGNLNWGAPSQQQVLDTALAWSVLNDHFEVADFLLTHGANINTDWSSHEPASILHELVFRENYAAMRFLIDRGIDMTLKDYRWGATAQGWAYYAANNEAMARWLGEAQRQRQNDAG